MSLDHSVVLYLSIVYTNLTSAFLVKIMTKISLQNFKFTKIIPIFFGKDWVGGIISAISLLALIKYGFDVNSWSLPIQAIANYYDALLSTVFTTLHIQQLLEFCILTISNYFDLENVPILYPHWKHIFIPLLIISNSLTLHTFKEGRWKFATWALFISFFIGLISSAFAGTIPLATDSVWQNFLIAGLPINAFFLTIYIVWLPMKETKLSNIKLLAIRITWATVILYTFTLLIIKSHIFSENIKFSLIFILLFIVVTGVRKLIDGYKNSKINDENFLNNQYTKRGLTMLSGVKYLIMILLSNAGLDLIHLA